MKTANSKTKTLKTWKKTYLVAGLAGRTLRQAKLELRFWGFDVSNMRKLLRTGGYVVRSNRVTFA